MFDKQAMLCQVANDGYAIQDGVLSDSEIKRLIKALENVQQGDSLLRRGRTYAVRNLLDLPEIGRLAESEPVRELAHAVLGDVPFPVRGILFDKIPEANWKVPWHQDVTIAVREKDDIEGFGPWSTKAGILHVQPPASVFRKDGVDSPSPGCV